MKKLFFALCLVMSIAVSAQTGTKNFIDQPYIEVTGKAEMQVVPDEIYLNILINEGDDKKTELEAKEKSMYQTLKSLGIDVEKDLAVKDFASNFNNRWLKKDEIQTSKAYQLIVHDGQTLSMVFMELEKISISNITIVHVDHSQKEAFRKDVKVKAIKAAKEKAVYLAQAIKQDAGNAIYILEQNNTFYRPQVASNAIMIRGTGSVKKESLPEIEFEKIKLESTMLVRFELKNSN